MIQISAQQLKTSLINNSNILLIDVRESFELDICRIQGSMHIPMSDIPSYLDKIDLDKDIVVMCHHGIRSAHVVNFLLQNGFKKVSNLEGGIHAWSMNVDRGMCKY